VAPVLGLEVLVQGLQLGLQLADLLLQYPIDLLLLPQLHIRHLMGANQILQPRLYILALLLQPPIRLLLLRQHLNNLLVLVRQLKSLLLVRLVTRLLLVVGLEEALVLLAKRVVLLL